MDFKNNIPAWAYGKKQAQADPNFAGEDEFNPQPEVQEPSGPMIRYSFPVHVTVDVPYNEDRAQEIAAANAAIDEAMQKLEGIFGDYVSHKPDTAVRSMRGSLNSEDVNLY